MRPLESLSGCQMSRRPSWHEPGSGQHGSRPITLIGKLRSGQAGEERLAEELAAAQDGAQAAAEQAARLHKALHAAKQHAKEADRRAEERGRELERLAVHLEAARIDAQVKQFVRLPSVPGIRFLVKLTASCQ